MSTALCLVLTVSACGGSASSDEPTTAAPTTTTSTATSTTTTVAPIPAWAQPLFTAEEIGAFAGLVIQY